MPERKLTGKRAPNKPKLLPPVEYLRELLHYDKNAGVLRWRERRREHFASERDWNAWNSSYAWVEAGTLVHNRCYIRIDGHRYSAYRVIWKLVTGDEPPLTIDHKDADETNNRWENLRPATPAEQQFNKSMQKNNTSGCRGVSRIGSKWRVEFWVNNIRYYLGLFDALAEAVAVRETVARELHGEFYREPEK